MRRKIIKQGKGGYTIYLPKKWVDERGIKRGDEINLEIDNGKIIIDSETHPESKSISIEITYNSMLRSVIGVVYRVGYNKIILDLKQEISLDELQKIALISLQNIVLPPRCRIIKHQCNINSVFNT